MSINKCDVYIIGICGTATGQLAIALKELNYNVAGSDQLFYPPISTLLKQFRLRTYTQFDPANIASEEPALVIVGNAISRGNPELEWVLSQRIRFTSLPEFIKDRFLWDRRSIVVAGTHGKTTSTALIAWILETAGLEPSFLIGGLPGNFQVGCRLGRGEWFVIEGDEYDTCFHDKRSKFIHYLPYFLVLNNVEYDHADIFPDMDTLLTQFRHLLRLLPQNGCLFVNSDDNLATELAKLAPCRVLTYAVDAPADIRPDSWQMLPNGLQIVIKGQKLFVPLYGKHNVCNAIAAIAVALECRIDFQTIQKALASFKGVARRMQIVGQINGVTVIDDFAHHPTAVARVLETLRKLHPQARLIAAFEPSTNTMCRNVLENHLADALALADVVVLAPIKRAGRVPLAEQLNLHRVCSTVESKGKMAVACPSLDSVHQFLVNLVKPGDVVCFMSNSDFGGCHNKLLQQLAIRRNLPPHLHAIHTSQPAAS